MDVYSRISKAINSDSIFHSYIIEGTRDDAMSLALYVAMGCNCISVTKKPCGQCLPCRKISKNNHPDVSIIQGNGSSIGIDMIRQMQKDIFIKPYEGKRKVYIIAEGEKMTLQAQNCLLKVLEEPPGTGIIIITSPNYHELIPTVISRCQILKFNVQDKSENQGLYLELLNCFMEQDFIEAFLRIDLIVKEQERAIEQFLDFLLTELRDALVFKATGQKDLLCFKEYEDIAKKIASRASYDGIDRLINAVVKAKEGLRCNANTQLTMEFLLLEMQEVLLC